MDIKDMYKAVLILTLVAILVGVGLTVLSNVATSVKTSGSILDESLVVASGAATTGNDEITLTTVIIENGTSANVIISGNESTDTRVNISADTGTVTTSINDGTYNVSYTYLVDTIASARVDTSVNSIGAFATWFAVIVVVIAAGVIIGIVIKSFRGA